MNTKEKNTLLLISTTNFFVKNGANSNRVRAIIEGLAQNNFNIHVVFTQGFGSLEELKKYGWSGKIENVFYSYTIFSLHNSIWFKRILAYLLPSIINKINSLLIKKKINKIKPDVIYLESTIEVFDIFLNIESKMNSINSKLLLELNEFDNVGLLHSTNKLQLIRAKKVSRLLLEEIIPKTDFLLIMTNHLIEYYKKFTNQEKVKIIHFPMTVDFQRFEIKKNNTDDDQYIAYCGSSSFSKDGVDILIKAFSNISSKYSNLKLKIAAFKENDGDKMIALINDLKMQDKIEYVGMLDRDLIPSFIVNAELLVLPRPDSKQAQGGFPTKLGEYLASGRPVCATSVGEIPLYLVDNESVFFAEPGSISSLVQSIERILTDPLNASRVGQNGKLVAFENFNKEKQTKFLADFLHDNLN